jgi:Uma2 family endonuclease
MTVKSRIRFSVSDYEEMHRSGFIPEHLRVELLDGEIRKMSPIGPRHSSYVMRLHRLLQKILGDQVTLFNQSPIWLSDNSMPQPDLYLVRNRQDDYEKALPTPADVYLLIEVSETSGDYDCEDKLPRYAEAGIPEVWIVDTVSRTIEQYHTPSGQNYLSEKVFSAGQQIVCSTLPNLSFDANIVLKV